RLGDDFPADGVGVNWTQRFVEKHSDRLQTCWGKSMDNKRGRAVNPHTNKAYFDLAEEVLVGKRDYEFDQALDDNSAVFFPAGGVRKRVIGPRGTQTQHQQSDGGHE
ncbi:hypothetical protein DFH08DRAFT_614394, partial [Mycena albidolilacea]